MKSDFHFYAKRNLIILTYTEEFKNTVCRKARTFIICHNAGSQILPLLSCRPFQRGIVVTQQFLYDGCNIIFPVFVIVLLQAYYFIVAPIKVTLSHNSVHPPGYSVSFAALTPEFLICFHLLVRYLYSNSFKAGNYVESDDIIVSK